MVSGLSGEERDISSLCLVKLVMDRASSRLPSQSLFLLVCSSMVECCRGGSRCGLCLLTPDRREEPILCPSKSYFPDRSQTKPVTLAREQFDQTVRTSSAPKQTQLPRRLSHTPCRPVQSKRLSSSLPEEGAREMGQAKVISKRQSTNQAW